MTDRAWVLDPDDPRAPAQEVWEQMSAEERAEVVASLPTEFPVSEAHPPEGDSHWEETARGRQTLKRWFGRSHRRVYVSGNLRVFYPTERIFSPDIIAVVDVDPHPRESWRVTAEGNRGLDFALDVVVSGRRREDLVQNVERYARLGITEYFVFDRTRKRLFGYRLPSNHPRQYEQLLPQEGRHVSQVLGLELALEGDRLRFTVSDAPLPDADELIGRLGHLVSESERRLLELEGALETEQRRREAEQRRREAEQRLREEEQRRREAEQRLREEEQRRREAVERELAQVREELEKLRRGS